MCRLLGIVSAEPIPYKILLKETPRSLSSLSKEHPDGWGMAVFRSNLHPKEIDSDQWVLYKGINPAEKDESFHEISSKISGETLISHVRKKTVGPVALENTHPFERDGWVFAHNGTLKNLDSLRKSISPAQAKKIQGETDSELFFALLLSRWEENGLLTSASEEKRARVLKEVVKEVAQGNHFGELTFLLSNGKVLYAGRFGPKSLYLLERGIHQGIQYQMQDGTVLQIPRSRRRHGLYLASEKMTNEGWREIKDGDLLRIDRLPKPSWRHLLISI
jgi:glutamine amidotransferase